ncbi:MAG: TonB family protein [Gemmatimonadaceae bacterium]|nr:TonB family protein [Gemmatimonadaceae bacterium]
MIARWMLGALVFSGLVSLAALAAEHLLRLARGARRTPWMLAILACVGWPMLAPFFVQSAPPTGAVGEVVQGLGNTVVPIAHAPSFDWTAAMGRLDPVLLTLWVVASATLLWQLVRAAFMLRRVQREARRADIDGAPVLVHDALGPAAIGVITPRVIVPTWLLELDPSLRALVLTHEQEHCRAGDSRVVWLGVLSTALMPWNTALWWLASRFRLAMEIDCDTRTLRGADPAPYARLLLLIAHRHGTARYVPTLSPTAAQLQRRIQAMQTTVIRFRVWHALAAAATGTLAIAAACSPRVSSNLTAPSPVEPPTTARVATTPTSSAATATVTPEADQRQEAVLLPGSRGPRYPESMRAAGVTANVFAQFVVNADGTVDTATLKIVRVTTSEGADQTEARAAFGAAVKASLAEMRYTAARVNGRDVRQLVSMPFAFSLAGPTPANESTVKPIPTNSSLPYFDFQVEKPAQARPGVKGPRYPEELRNSKIEGRVLAQFVVDADGVPDMSTFKAVKSDHQGFTDAVRAALADMRFEPAMIGGKRVKQLMQAPFEFSLSR